MKTLTPSRTVLIDSLLHPNKTRVLLGAVCGLVAGAIFLGFTMAFTPEGASSIWWIQLLATPFFGGAALAFGASSAVLIAGAVTHFGLSIFLGALFGKITTGTTVKHLLPYGLVLGGLCWLASNLFAPDFIDIAGLATVGEWLRMLFFQSFSLSLAILVGFLSKPLAKPAV